MESDFKLGLNDIRSLTILQELPFTISFNDRVEVTLEQAEQANLVIANFCIFKILESFSYKDSGVPGSPAYKIRIRRDHLYEDAFDNLSLENGKH